MPKIPTERRTLNGPTMGTRWSTLFHAGVEVESDPLLQAMQTAVDEVDRQMTTWDAASDLMRFNRTPTGEWQELPERLMHVLSAGLEIGHLSGGAFDIAMGDATTAWGFGADPVDPERIQVALKAPRMPAHEALELDVENRRARKHAPLALDLSGIAKGYGVDRLADVAREAGITSALLSIDGELVGIGLQPDGDPWGVAIEKPDPNIRSPHAIVTLHDAAVATSGDYRHWVNLGDARLSHTMDPERGGPLQGAPASVSVIARNCMEADAFATALMVMGEVKGKAFAESHDLNALFLMRSEVGLREVGIGPIFGADEA